MTTNKLYVEYNVLHAIRVTTYAGWDQIALYEEAESKGDKCVLLGAMTLAQLEAVNVPDKWQLLQDYESGIVRVLDLPGTDDEHYLAPVYAREGATGIRYFGGGDESETDKDVAIYFCESSDGDPYLIFVPTWWT